MQALQQKETHQKKEAPLTCAEMGLCLVLLNGIKGILQICLQPYSCPLIHNESPGLIFQKEQIINGKNGFEIRHRFYCIVSSQAGSHLNSNYFKLFLKILKMRENSLGAPLQHQKCYSSNVEVKLSTRCSSKILGHRDYNDKSHHLRWAVQLGKLPYSEGVMSASTHCQSLPSLPHRQTLTGLACHFHRSF